MYFRKKRAEIIARDLFDLRVVKKTRIEQYQISDGLFITPEEADKNAKWREFNRETDRFSGHDANFWFKTEIRVPQEYDGKPFWLLWEDGHNSSLDSLNCLVFVNGEPYGALDRNHKDFYITAAAKPGDVYRVDIQAYVRVKNDGYAMNLFFGEVDPRVDRLYYDLIVPLRAADRMAENDKARIDLEVAVEKVVNAIDFRTPHSPGFFASVERALEISEKEIYTDLAGHSDVIATCVGHTHIDVAWLWTVAQTRQKTARSFATFLRFMDEYPEFKFMSSQPQLYEFIKEWYPKQYDRIKELIKEGRWEAEGGMWLEADCNIPSGESFVRQFLYGKRFFMEELGVESKILWLPDVFGYSANLPQIMKKSNVDYFMTTKISWNQFNRLPYDTMVWRGIDGSEVFVHMITTTGSREPFKNHSTTYNGKLHPNDVMGAWERYQQKDINNDVLISYGYGDGGGGPTREMIETGIRMQKGLKGMPKVRFESSLKYFEELHSRVKDSKDLPLWVGDLYLEYHRGTYTSIAKNKRYNRKLEFMLQELEFYSVLANDGTYPADELHGLWKNLLLNQFHDILPGSSIKEVYDVTDVEYAAMNDKLAGLIDETLVRLAGRVNGSVAVFNPLSFDRSDIVTLNLDDGAEAVEDSDGNVYPVQKTADGGFAAFIKNIPAHGALGLNVSSGKPAAVNSLEINGFDIDTPFYSVKFDLQGMITSLYDKQNDRQVLKEGRLGNELRVFEDKPMYWDNWDIDIFHTEKSWPVNDVARMEWLERGPVRAALLIERQFESSRIIQTIYFYADSRRIDFDTFADWKQRQCLLKVVFPVDVNAVEATYDMQFGNLKRPAHTNTSWDAAKFEVCGHKWADLSEGGYGVSLLTDCKYGYSIIDGEMCVSLIKSGVYPFEGADKEEHKFTYSLLPHAGTWQDAQINNEGYMLNVPARGIVKKNTTGGVSKIGFISVSADNVIIETVKKAENNNGYIIRAYEFENRRTKAAFKLSMPGTVHETNLLEDRIGEISTENGSFEVEFKPYEIKTFYIGRE